MLSSWIRGFRVSKQMMASKQPSSPSFFKTVAAWFFARVCENLHTGATVSFFCSYKLVLANYSFFLANYGREIQGHQEELTIFLCGRESSSCLRTGSGFSFSYGGLP
jgi:hypothetical protein